MDKSKKTLTVKELKQRLLKNADFKREYEEQTTKFQIARQVIEARLRKNLTQAELARKINTDQAVISRLEGISSKPSISLLERVAKALDTKIRIIVG